MGLKAFAMACCVGTILSTSAIAQTAPPRYSSLYIFGDSLVDAGNIAVFTRGTTPSPASGYVDGRFTNGYDYTDLLSVALYGKVTTASLLGGTNFAYGGARVVDTGDTIPDLNAQISSYKTRIGAAGAADAGALYILNFGGNDIFGADRGQIGTAKSVDLYLQAAAAQYAQGVADLNRIGARNILITGFPVATSALSKTAEGYLKTELDALSLTAGSTLLRYSYLDFFDRVQKNPNALGLPVLDTTTTCIAARAQPNCEGLFSFDGTHPTAAVQAALFRDIDAQFNLTGSVPEPATWGLMILGFGVAGSALRRRRKRPMVPAIA